MIIYEWKYYYVYKIINITDGMTYVGQRKTNKLPELDNYWGSGKIITAAIKKYGRSNFKKEIIELCSDWDELNLREIFWINELNTICPNGYNLCIGGRGGITFGENNSNYKKSPSIEIKKRISEKLKGMKRDPESIEKQKRTNKENPIRHTEETKLKMSILKKGLKQSEEHIRKLTEIRKGKKFPDRHYIPTLESREKNRLAHIGLPSKKAKMIDVYSIDGILIKTYKSLKDLNLEMKGTRRIIVECCDLKRESYRNYIFKWHVTEE